MKPLLLVLFLSIASSEQSRLCDEDSLENCPFNDLSSEELSLAVQIIRNSGQFSAGVQFPIVRAQEPSKSEWNLNAPQKRLAFAAIFDDDTNTLSELILDLDQQSILSVTPQPSKLPALMNTEDKLAHALFLNDSRVKVAYERRGLNFSNARCDSWVLGAIAAKGHPEGKRLVRVLAYYQIPDARFSDWHPIEALEVTVDVNSKTVYKFLDRDTVPAPADVRMVDEHTVVRHSHGTLKPLKISHPEGSSIEVKGQHVSWYKWKLMYSMDTIHGLQLFQVRYHGDCEDRLVLYKVSISEMFVPYGSLSSFWRWRNPFDAGEYGLGRLSTPLAVGVDVPENALLFNCTLVADDTGEVEVKPACVGAYERDAGILYKHTDYDTGTTSGKRARELVLTFTAVIGNYDYAYEYIFKMDGAMEVKVRLTGLILPRGVSSVKNDATCIDSCVNLINTNLEAPVHQHFFNYRLDFDIESELNSVLEVDVVHAVQEGSNAANREAFTVKKALLKSETWRDWSLKRSRSWHVVNSKSRNKFGSMRGYALQPTTSVGVSFLAPNGLVYPQAQFVTHPFWATVYKDEEQGAAGPYPRSGEAGQGLPNYLSDKEVLEDSDVVIWYTLGVTHVTRPEEFPIMSGHDVGFQLVPVNFMSKNPEIRESSNECYKS